MDHVEFHLEPPTNIPTMVIAFSGWINAGRAATGSLNHLIRHLSAARLATIDPETFFVFTQERPKVRRTNTGERVIEWPKSEFHVWRAPEGQEGLLLFNSREPHQKWRVFIRTLLDVAEQCGVQRMVSFGSYLAGTPHTRTPQVTARTTLPAWQKQLESWGIYRRPGYEGPTGIVPCLLDAATQRGLPHLDFMGQSPHYLQGVENPAVMQALLTYGARLLNLDLDVSQFDRAVEIFRTRCDRAVARDSETQAHVQDLERDYDANAEASPLRLQDDDLNTDQLMQELEDFLRDEREQGGEG